MQANMSDVRKNAHFFWKLQNAVYMCTKRSGHLTEGGVLFSFQRKLTAQLKKYIFHVCRNKKQQQKVHDVTN